MIGLDINVLVRYIVQDDPKQSARTVALIEGLGLRNRANGCEATYTFDRRAARSSTHALVA